MVLQYDPRQVVLNLLQLRSVVYLMRPEKKAGERRYSGLINMKKGTMLFSFDPEGFAEIYAEIKETGGKEEDWKPIYLKVYAKREGDQFVIIDEEGNTLNLASFAKEAKKVAQITLDFLNQQSKHARKEPVEQAVLEDLRVVSDFFAKEIEKIAGFQGRIDREEAERRLEGKHMGSYLLRLGNDTVDNMIRMIFVDQAEPFLYLIATYLVDEEQFGEKLLIEDGGWFVYNDVPDPTYYRDRKFPTLEALLRTIEELKFPI